MRRRPPPLATLRSAVLGWPGSTHRSAAVDLTLKPAVAGGHVLLDKPIARTVEEADAIIADTEISQRTPMVAYPHRYRKSMRVCKDAVCADNYGELFMLDALMYTSFAV